MVSGVCADTTIGQLPFCTPAKDILAGENYTTLSAALAAAKDVVIGDIPAGKLIVVAPDNDAFAAVLKQLDLTAEELLADTDLLANVLAVHVAIAADDSAEYATAISGDKLNFELAGKPATLADVVAAEAPVEEGEAEGEADGECAEASGEAEGESDGMGCWPDLATYDEFDRFIQGSYYSTVFAAPTNTAGICISVFFWLGLAGTGAWLGRTKRAKKQ